MKVILFLAQTINGIIARTNYEEDFLSDKNWQVFLDITNNADAMIIGRKTYEIVKEWKEYNFDTINKTKIIISKNKNFKLEEGFILASSPEKAISIASKRGFKKIIIAGGSKIYSAFIKKNLVDEMIINIEPHVLGNGIRNFSQDNFERKLKLLKVKKVNSRIIQIQYKVIK